MLAVRETYEAAKGLTSHFGTEHRVSTPRVEKYNRQTTVDLTRAQPRQRPPRRADRRGPRTASPRALSARDASSSSPAPASPGIPRGNTKTVLAAGLLRAATPPSRFTPRQWGTQGFNGYADLHFAQLATRAGLHAFRRPAAALQAAAPTSRPEAANDTIADLVDRSGRQPVYQIASASLERELPGVVDRHRRRLHVGREEPARRATAASTRTPSRSKLSATATSSTTKRSAARCGLIRNTTASSCTARGPRGRYQREAGYVRLEKRSSQGLSAQRQLRTSRKQMDDYSGPYGTQDYFNRRNEWSLHRRQQPSPVLAHLRLRTSPGAEQAVSALFRLAALPGRRLVPERHQHFASGEPAGLYVRSSTTPAA